MRRRVTRRLAQHGRYLAARVSTDPRPVIIDTITRRIIERHRSPALAIAAARELAASRRAPGIIAAERRAMIRRHIEP